MADKSTIDLLMEDERKLLELCGITTDEQLARIDPQVLQLDIEKAAHFFVRPHSSIPSLERLETLCRQAAISVQNSREAGSLGGRSGQIMLGKLSYSSTNLPANRERKRLSAATGRLLETDEGASQATELDERRKKDNPRSFSHAICSSHPLATYLGAWFTCLVIIGVIALLVVVFGLLVDIEIGASSRLVAAAVLLVIAIYAYLLRRALCSTCRISIFSFRRYPRHRDAHYIPLLGHTLATALSIIFLFRYRCPSCATPQKLFGRRHRH